MENRESMQFMSSQNVEIFYSCDITVDWRELSGLWLCDDTKKKVYAFIFSSLKHFCLLFRVRQRMECSRTLELLGIFTVMEIRADRLTTNLQSFVESYNWIPIVHFYRSL